MSDTKITMPAYVPPPPRRLLEPHRIFLITVFAVIVFCIVWYMRWDWLPKYRWKLLEGIGETLFLLFSTAACGFLLALPLGLVQVTGPRPLAWLARGFCTLIRGTPLLLQLCCFTTAWARSSPSTRKSANRTSGPICARPGPTGSPP